MLSGTKMWKNGFHSLIFMLYGLVGGVVISESHDFFPTGHWKIYCSGTYVHQGDTIGITSSTCMV